jgi:hypothetical protein
MTQNEPQLTRSVDEPEAVTHSIGARLRRAIAVPFRLIAALIFPDRGMPHAVGRERGGPALIALVLCAGLGAFVIGSRVDPTAAVLQEETMRMRGPDAEARSDREIQEEIDKRRTMTQVKLGLSAGLYLPLVVGLLAVGVFMAGRFVGGKPNMQRSFAAASHAMLPQAVKSVAIAIAAWPAERIAPMDVERLSGLGAFGPVGPFQTLDGFVLWTGVLLIFGLAAAAQITRRRALVTTIILLTLFLLLTGEVGAQGPGGPGGHPMPRGA